MSIIAVSSYKGGVGKSTTTMNLAEACRRAGVETVVVDIDASTRTTSRWFGNYAPINGESAPLPPTMYLAGEVGEQIVRLKQVYKLVIVDCGAGNTRENQQAIRCADLLLVPLAPSDMEVAPTLQFAHEIVAAQLKNSGRPLARLVLNKIQAAKPASRDLIDLALSPQCPVKPLQSIVPERAIMGKLFSSGISVFDAPRSGDMRDIYTAMAQEVLGLAVR